MKSLLINLTALSLISAKSIQDMTEGAANAIETIAHEQGRSLKLAITIPEPSTGVTENNRFGAMVSNLLYSELLKKTETIQVFERQRLKAIAMEQQLLMSQFMSESNVNQIGQLVPIDYLLIGQWELLDEKVSITVRLVDVTTGSLALSLTEIVDLDDNSEALLLSSGDEELHTTEGTTQTEVRDSGSICPDAILEDVRDAIASGDIGRSTIGLLTTIPVVDSGCRFIHLDAVYRLNRQGVVPEQYVSYLIEQLIIEGRIDRDNLAQMAVRLLASDDTISYEEWELTMALAVESNRAQIYFYEAMMGDTMSLTDTTELFNRIDHWQIAVEKGEAGKPTLYSREEGFRDMATAIGYQDFASNKPAEHEQLRNRALLHTVHAFDILASIDTLSESDQEYIYRLLYHLVGRDARTGGLTIENIIEKAGVAYRANVDDLVRAEALLPLLQFCESEATNDRNSEEVQQSFATYCEQLTAELSPVIAEVFSAFKMPYKKTGAAVYAMRHGIESEFVPKIEDLTATLSGNSDVSTLVQTAKILAAAGERAAPAEARTIRMLNRTDRMEQTDQINYLKGELLVILENLGTDSDEAVNAVIAKAVNGNDRVREQAYLTLNAQGKSAWRALTDKLDPETPTDELVGVICALGKMSTEYGDTVSKLDRLSGKVDDPDVLDAIDDAIDLLEL